MTGPELEHRLASLRDALSGQVLAGSDGRRYPLGERVGEGGQGWIFRATWNGSVDVVVKVLRPDAVTRDALARFQREAAVLRTMSQQPAPNPHVVRYYDHASATLTVPGTADTWTFPFTVLEYVEGETLAAALARERGDGLGLERTRRILRHIVLALRDVHAQNIVHRDLKPSNVLIDTMHGQGAREIAKVTDFGLAKVFGDSLHRTVALAGATVGYAPPEQFERGNPRVGKPTDVFSLGAILFEMLTGEPCFPVSDPLMVLHILLQGDRPTFAKTRDRLPSELRARPDVVAALDGVLSRALASSPDARYATVTLFHDAVEDALSRLGPAAGLRMSDRPPAVGASGPGDRAVFSGPASQVSGDGATLSADAASLSAPSFSAPSFSADAGRGRNSVELPGAPPPSVPPMHWQMRAAPAWRKPLRAITLSQDGSNAVGIGADGLAYWSGLAWTRLELPRFVAPATVEALAWFGSHVVVAGASSTVHLRAPDGTYTPFTFGLPGLVFHGAYADSTGILLAGEQLTHGGAVGVIAAMNLQQASVLALAWARVPEAGPLRAVSRIHGRTFACGDRGVVTVLKDGVSLAAEVCPQPLLALAPAGDGGAIAVGAGGFVFHVLPTLEARLEAVQTTRALTAVTQSSDGGLWAGGEDRRILRRGAGGWVRAGVTVGVAGATVRALSAGSGRVTAFCDDGSVLEGYLRG